MSNAKKESPYLASFLKEVRQSHDIVRVVAHSLGCFMLINALSIDYSEEEKEHFLPDYVHLCAPAITQAKSEMVLQRGVALKAARL